VSDVIVDTLKDVAKLCKVHPVTLRGWVKKGMPREKSTKPRTKFQYDIKKIEEWRAVRLSGNQGGTEIVSLSDEEFESVKAKIEKFKGAIDFYKVNRADIFARKQMSYQKLADYVLSTMTQKDIDNAKLTEKLAVLKVLDVGSAIFYDKERLERGESTQNVSVLITAIKELKNKRERESIPETSRAATG
jgi:hypothetical protein